MSLIIVQGVREMRNAIRFNECSKIPRFDRVHLTCHCNLIIAIAIGCHTRRIDAYALQHSGLSTPPLRLRHWKRRLINYRLAHCADKTQLQKSFTKSKVSAVLDGFSRADSNRLTRTKINRITSTIKYTI